MDHLTTKTNSFRVIGQRPLSRATHEVILVHPFQRIHRFGSILELWIEGSIFAPGVNGRLVARVFSFDGQQLLNEGPDAFKKQSDKLKEKIKTLHTDKASPLSRALSSKSRVTSRDSSVKSGVRKPALIFIGHSLGSWVVKDALASRSNENLALDTIGVIFVDVPTQHTMTAAGYSAYNQELLEKLCFRRPPRDWLAGSLASIEEHFQQLKGVQYLPDAVGFNKTENSAKETVKPSRQPKYLDIWLNESPVPLPEEFGRRARFSLRVVRIMKRGTSGFISTPESLRQLGLDKILLEQIITQEKFSHTVKNDPSSVLKTNPASNTALADTMLLAETGLLDDLDKNMPVWSEDISRPGSMRFTLNLSGNSKASSIYSISPARGDFLDAETKRLAILGISFLESGELGNAEILFKRSISMLDGKQSGTKHLDRIHLQTHIAVIRLYRGRYHDAKRDFDLIEKEMDSLKTDDESGANFEARNEITRWSAISLLHQGQYIDAVAKFEKVLAKRREAHSRLEKAIVGDIQVRRDLALAYGYLGQYTEATKHIKEAESSFKAPTSFGKGDESVKPSMNRTSQAINRGPTNVLDGQIGFPKVIGKGYSVVFASAVLDMLWGEYQSALKKATLALQGICEKLGRKHPRTLELASLKALLLAYNSKYLEAEVLCKDTLQVLADKLGREHPLTLETWGSLVYIFRAQSRFAEALDTANSLCKMTETSLSADHPQTLRAKSLLAAVHFSLGEYHSAERAIQQVVKVSEERYGNSTPDTLRYRSELARVLYLCGRIDEAKAMALDVIKKQREIYSPSHGQTKGLQKSTSIWFSSLEPQKILDRILRDIDNERRTFKQHPSLVFTLQTIATIEMQTQNADINLAQHLLKTVVNRRTAKLGSLHALTLLSQYELASVLRENDQQSQGLEMAREMFHHVWEGRSKLYSITHPETLSAKRELIITHCVCGIWQNGGPNLGLDTKSQFLFKEQQYLGAERCNKGQAYPELTFAQWADVEYVSLDIFNLQDTQLGPNHPETLKSLLWLFTVRLLLHGRRETNAMSTADMILRRLRQETVRSERLIEALRMEEKVALILADQGYYLEAIEILNDVAHTVTQYGSIDPALRPGLETVQRDVAGDLSDLKWRPEVKKHQEQMTELHAGWISAFDEKNFSVAEEKINQVYKLSKLLLGKESEGTLSSLYELALTKWAKSSLEDEREAFDIISRLNSLYEKHLSPDLRNNVRSKEKLWSKSISDRSELEQKEKNLD